MGAGDKDYDWCYRTVCLMLHLVIPLTLCSGPPTQSGRSPTTLCCVRIDLVEFKVMFLLIPSSVCSGRLLGGSSGINYLVRTRASAPEYDAWDEFGSGWNWKSLLPYFKAGERYETYAWGTDQIFPGITKEEDEEARRKEPEFRGHNGAVFSTHSTVYTDLLKPTIETTLKFHIRTNRTPVCNLLIAQRDYGTDTNN